MEKLYRVKMNENGMPNFSTAEEVEPKHGEWSFIGDNMFECSHCGITYSTKQFDAIRNYTTDPFAPEHCPKCGAKMKGADDE